MEKSKLSISSEPASKNNDIVDLFWTGGWDSTFRLMQLVRIEKKVVRPHYIIMPQQCTGKEIDTIHNIKRAFGRQYSECKDQILPVEFFNVDKLEPNLKITEEYERIKKREKINKQYEVCARYCEQFGYPSVELCVVRDEMHDYFRNNDVIFKYFRYPVSRFVKKEMAKIAEEHNFLDLMKMTWFCRRSDSWRPCGLCGPCANTVKGGLAWRLPLLPRMKAYIQLPFREWWRKHYHKQSEGAFKYVSKILKKRM